MEISLLPLDHFWSLENSHDVRVESLSDGSSRFHGYHRYPTTLTKSDQPVSFLVSEIVHSGATKIISGQDMCSYLNLNLQFARSLSPLTIVFPILLVFPFPALATSEGVYLVPSNKIPFLLPHIQFVFFFFHILKTSDTFVYLVWLSVV